MIVIKCDICETEIDKTDARYELVFKNIFGTTKMDICRNCVQKMRDEAHKRKGAINAVDAM